MRKFGVFDFSKAKLMKHSSVDPLPSAYILGIKMVGYLKGNSLTDQQQFGFSSEPSTLSGFLDLLT